MSEDFKEANSNIIETKDLGEGRRQVTFSVPSSEYEKMHSQLAEAGVSVEGYKLGKGSVLNRFDPSTRSTYFGAEYSSNNYPYTEIFNNLPNDPHQKIRLAVELYFKEPIVGSVVDMMVDFSSSGFTNECDDLEVKKIYDKWCQELNINEVLEKIFLEYYRSGNVTIYRNKDNAKVKKKRKKGITGEVDITEYQFPSNYSILNPMNVYINGSLFFNKILVQLKVSSEMQYMFNSMNGDSPNNYLPDMPVDMWKDKHGDIFMTLDDKLITRITRKKMDYERYASPFLERVFEPIMYKAKLRLMDMATIEGLVNQLVTVTVGDKDFPASDEDLHAIAELFQTPSKAYTVFWNHTLQVKFHKPEGIDTLTSDKYKQVNEDIMAGLGISRSLLDGGGGSGSGGGFSNSWVSILSLIERLDNARSKVKYWLESEYKRIAQENGFKTYPSVRFNKMNLREDTYIRDVLLAMYDRGLIDEEDILTEIGRDYQSIIDQKKRNKKNSSLFFPPEQPFQGGQTAPKNGRPTGQPAKKMPNRKPTPEKNSGKAPKVRKATASIESYEEDYANELISQYASIEADIVAMLNQNEGEDERTRKVIVTAALLSLFRSLASIGHRYIASMFDEELLRYSESTNIANAIVTKADLIEWNNSYVTKLAHDIQNGISEAVDSGTSIDDAVASAFKSNKYRIALISQSGAIESIRKASIIGNEVAGSIEATWVAHLDDNTCSTCRGLHGRSFALADIPERPHANCRCSLEFN
jgi:uncharacterized membrane protein YgcG